MLSMHAHGDDAEPGPTPLPADEHTGTGTRIRAAMGSAESLSVAALLVAVLTLSSSLPTQLFAWIALNLDSVNGVTQRDLAFPLLQAAGHGVFAVLTLALASTAIARADVFSPSWVRGVAGGAAIAGLVGGIVALIAAVLPLVA